MAPAIRRGLRIRNGPLRAISSESDRLAFPATRRTLLSAGTDSVAKGRGWGFFGSIGRAGAGTFGRARTETGSPFRRPQRWEGAMSGSDHVAVPPDPTIEDRGRPPRVIIASDVLLYREGLAASLVRDGRLDVAAAASGAEAFAAAVRLAPGAVLVDATTERGLALARRFHAACPSIRLIGFGISGGGADVIACAEAGLAAFVDRDGTIDALVAAVLGALRGELACSPRIAAMMCDRLASLAGAKPETAEPLTRREREVAALIAEGLSNKEIAIDLRIGPATVKNHVHNILDKLNVRRRAAIATRLGEAAPAIVA